MTVFPAKINAADDHLINGAPIGVFAMTIGSAYALMTNIDVKNALNSTHRPLYGSDIQLSETHRRDIKIGNGDSTQKITTKTGHQLLLKYERCEIHLNT